MIIQCDKCSTKFRIDDSKVTGAGVKVRCTKCHNVFIAAPPAPQQGAPAESTETTQSSAGSTPPPPQEDKNDVDFNFDQQEQPAASSSGFSADTGGSGYSSGSSNEGASAETNSDSGGFQAGSSSNFDLTGGPDAEGEGQGYGASGSQNLSVGGEFNFDDTPPESHAPQQDTQPEENQSEGLDTGSWKLPAEQETGEAPAAPTRESVVSYAVPQPKSTKRSTEEKTAADTAAEPHKSGIDESAFDKTADELESLVRNLPGEEAGADMETGDAEGAGAGKKAAKHAGGSNGLAVGIIIIAALAIIGGAAYFKGLFSPPQTQVAQKTVDITGINGSFVDNKAAGRLLVIQAKITNITGSPQTVRGVKGVIYGPKNEKLSNIMVSAGRTLTQEDLKNLSKEDIIKAFKDMSSTAIPPKGSAPVMIVFTTVPQNMSEFGIEIIR